MTDNEEKEMKASASATATANAEYIYIIEDQDVWFVDYIIGIAFKTPIEFTPKKDDGVGLAKSGRLFMEFYDIKDLQDYIEERVGQEIAIESSIDPITNLELDDRRIIWHFIEK